MQTITPCLWFDNNLEEAMNFYLSVFKNGKILNVSRNGDQVFTAEFELNGQRLMGLNGGPIFKFTEAISLFVSVKTQAEVDELWQKLTADGGEESQCGWLKDKFGLSWQIVPEALGRLLNNPDPVKAGRAMQAMLQMRKLDIAALEKASEGI
ncbi:MAG TPA: VOC family protein [Thermoflexales bacterium]|nr:VOC family protein [Thermoflexales bacterium]HQW35018.1 VOC family protein [Thermoflexales bacterium]HQX75107.1 VOC family protein [Thermoflexales bacterium]HQZ21843.1 VOC family protein [Thermoflexales bacterium]HQZ99453.1 VOC family protein [Thermoflexales bacterium]